MLYNYSNKYIHAVSSVSDQIPNRKETHYNLRRIVELETPIIRTLRYENSFFPYCIREWEDELKSLPTLQSFKKHHVTFIHPNEHSFHGITDNVGIKLLTKIRVEFSDLRDHRFSHNFNCTSPLCKCGLEDETTSHYIFRCPLHNKHRSILLSNVSDVS